jgi:hypothetical protein
MSSLENWKKPFAFRWIAKEPHLRCCERLVGAASADDDLELFLLLILAALLSVTTLPIAYLWSRPSFDLFQFLFCLTPSLQKRRSGLTVMVSKVQVLTTNKGVDDTRTQASDYGKA